MMYVAIMRGRRSDGKKVVSYEQIFKLNAPNKAAAVHNATNMGRNLGLAVGKVYEADKWPGRSDATKHVSDGLPN